MYFFATNYVIFYVHKCVVYKKTLQFYKRIYKMTTKFQVQSKQVKHTKLFYKVNKKDIKRI